MGSNYEPNYLTNFLITPKYIIGFLSLSKKQLRDPQFLINTSTNLKYKRDYKKNPTNNYFRQASSRKSQRENEPMYKTAPFLAPLYTQ